MFGFEMINNEHITIILNYILYLIKKKLYTKTKIVRNVCVYYTQ